MHVITTHGGTAGALDAQVLKLVQWLKARDDRRYGPEWCMMRIQGGSTSPSPAALRASRTPAGHEPVYRHASASSNGVAMTGALQLTSADGWQFICLQQTANSTGYHYRFL